MRNEPNLRAEKWRCVGAEIPAVPHGSNAGVFLPIRWRHALRVLSSGKDSPFGWEHVSVSHAERCPTWDEMCFVKDLLWYPEEVVVQFHPSASSYVNLHPNCLHLWKKSGEDWETPPLEML